MIENHLPYGTAAYSSGESSSSIQGPGSSSAAPSALGTIIKDAVWSDELVEFESGEVMDSPPQPVLVLPVDEDHA